MSQELNEIIHNALEDLKAKDIVSLDVSELTDVMDTLIIASGTSSRHVKSLASNAVQDAAVSLRWVLKAWMAVSGCWPTSVTPCCTLCCRPLVTFTIWKSSGTWSPVHASKTANK